MGRRDGGGGAFADVPCIDETMTNEASTSESFVTAQPIMDCGLLLG